MPQLLNYLNIEADDPAALDFGTIAVYRCVRARMRPPPGVPETAALHLQLLEELHARAGRAAVCVCGGVCVRAACARGNSRKRGVTEAGPSEGSVAWGCACRGTARVCSGVHARLALLRACENARRRFSTTDLVPAARATPAGRHCRLPTSPAFRSLLPRLERTLRGCAFVARAPRFARAQRRCWAEAKTRCGGACGGVSRRALRNDGLHEHAVQLGAGVHLCALAAADVPHPLHAVRCVGVAARTPPGSPAHARARRRSRIFSRRTTKQVAVKRVSDTQSQWGRAAAAQVLSRRAALTPLRGR